MKTYERYKPSGIDWIGDIPERWEVKKLKHVASLKSGEGIISDSISDEGEYPVYGGNGLRGYYSSFTHEGDFILIGRQGALCGNVNYASGKFWASEHAVVVTLLGKYEVTWLGELLRTMNLNQYSQSAAQPGLAVETIKNLTIPVPTLPEQTAIAKYLDHKTAQIDKLIEGKRGLIALLKEERSGVINQAVTRGIDPDAKLKPSGIDWLGEIPEHWEAKKLKWICQITDCKHTTPNYIEVGIPVVSTGNVKPAQISFDSARKVSQEDFEELSEGGRRPLKNDIIYSRNASVGAAALVRTEEDFCLGQDICLIRSGENQEFLENVLNCNYLAAQLESVLVGSTFRRINIQQIKEFVITLPQKQEQDALVEYIKVETSKIDATINKIGKEIEYLREYRTALISEVVTGKIKVV